MDQIKVFDDLYMFRSGGENLPINFNQYLLQGTQPLLVHTGSAQQASELVPKIKSILGDTSLSYVFISHFEGDECGGIATIMESFPNAAVICSQITARQLSNFGLNYNVLVKTADDTLSTGEYNLQFISYPAEMHLWEGLLAFETNRQLLFSSDLMIRMDRINAETVDGTALDEINKITSKSIPSTSAREALQQKLRTLPIKTIAPGHGPVLRTL